MLTMPPYPLACHGCGKPALFKIASRWSDGFTAELKTYGLVCEACLPATFVDARLRQQRCRLTHDEQLFPPQVFRILGDYPSRELRHEPGLEAAALRVQTRP